jgi:GntR family transcriptional regulator of arabinose operon
MVQRYEGYCNAMRNASLEMDEGMIFKNEPDEFVRLRDAIEKREITAVFAVNDLRGLELINQLTDEGISIPGDVSIIGFDDYDASKMARVPLSTVRQHFEEEGYYAARLLLEIMAGSPLQYSRILIGTQLIVRSSTGSPQPASEASP